MNGHVARYRSALLLLAALLAAPLPVNANLEATGSAFTVAAGEDYFGYDTYVRAPEISPSVPTGFVVVWNEERYRSPGRRPKYFNHAQLYDGDGQPTGASFRVDQGEHVYHADVNAHPSEGFSVVWASQEKTRHEIFGRVFDGRGVARGDPVVIDPLREDDLEPRAAHSAWLSAQEIVVVWLTYDPYDSSLPWAIYARRFDEQGNPRDTDPILVSGPDAGDASQPRVVALGDGRAAVLWKRSKTTDRDESVVAATILRADGAVAEPMVVVDHPGVETVDDVAALAGGGFLFLFRSRGTEGGVARIHARRFDDRPYPVGSEITVNENTAGDPQRARVAALADGSFAVVWATDDDDPERKYRVDTRRFAPAGAALGTEIAVRPAGPTPLLLGHASIAELSPGHVVVAYEDQEPVGGWLFQNIRVQRFTYEAVETTSTTSMPASPACGDVSEPSNAQAVTVGDVLTVLQAAVGLATCERCRCDIDGDWFVTVRDALQLLRHSVGISVPLRCPIC